MKLLHFLNLQQVHMHVHALCKMLRGEAFTCGKSLPPLSFHWTLLWFLTDLSAFLLLLYILFTTRVPWLANNGRVSLRLPPKRVFSHRITKQNVHF